MKTSYNKLVRDKIPQIIKAHGCVPSTHIAGDDEYWEKLVEKLQEELTEFSASNGDPNELADMLEVIYAICEFKGISRKGLEKVRKEKEQKRGAFKKRIILEETNDL